MKQTTTSETWFILCETLTARRELCHSATAAAAASSPTSPLPLQLSLSVRLRRDIVPDIVMADVAGTASLGATPTAGMKRGRDEDDDGTAVEGFDEAAPVGKKARPTSGDSTGTWPRDSVLGTPTASISHFSYQAPKYDSDDQSSMVSEPGSPQDVSMSDDDMLDEDNPFCQSSSNPQAPVPRNSPWSTRMLQRGDHRVPTPIQPPVRPGIRPLQQPIGDVTRQHVRQRHPQEILSSPYSSHSIASGTEHLDVPSPIDEDEVPTPPSAAEAAGSQLSMLSVNDMDVETEGLPSISISPSELPSMTPLSDDMESAITDDGNSPMHEGIDGRESRLFVRKQRQRSGALSATGGSPVRPTQSELAMEPLTRDTAKRGLSMGYRADCERCRLKVPGHFNHFVAS